MADFIQTKSTQVSEYRIILAHQRRVLNLYDPDNGLERKERVAKANRVDYELFGSSSQKITLIQEFQEEIGSCRRQSPYLEEEDVLVRERLKTLKDSLDKLKQDSVKTIFG